MESVSLNHFAEHKKNLTASLAAWLLAYFPDNKQWEAGHFESLVAGVDGACLQTKSIVIQKSVLKRDSQVADRVSRFLPSNAIVKVYTNYEVALELLNAPDIIQLVEREEDADFILTVSHFKTFTTLPLHQRVCQFPFEAGFVRKVPFLSIPTKWYSY